MTTASLRVLVVEDDYFAAEQLAREIRANGDVGGLVEVRGVPLADARLTQCADERAVMRERQHLMQPENNLAIQTEVIRHADAFVGTYGGFSYLAPLSGVNTIAAGWPRAS